MKNTLLCCLLILLGYDEARSQSVFNSEQVKYVMEFKISRDRSITDADSLVLFSNADYLIYWRQKYSDPVQTEYHPSTSETKVSRLRDSIYNHYFIHKRGEKIGFEYIFREGETQTGRQSVEQYLTMNDFPADLRDPSMYRLTSKEENGPVRTEFYGDPDPGTQVLETLTIIYDERAKKLEHSLSPVFERLSSSKIVKLALKRVPNCPPEEDGFIPTLTQTFELKKVDIHNWNLEKVVKAFLDESGKKNF